MRRMFARWCLLHKMDLKLIDYRFREFSKKEEGRNELVCGEVKYALPTYKEMWNHFMLYCQGENRLLMGGAILCGICAVIDFIIKGNMWAFDCGIWCTICAFAHYEIMKLKR